MSRKLVIITEIIAPYRIPIFNALARENGIDLHVIFLAETDSTQRDWIVYKEEIAFSCEVLPNWGTRVAGHYLLLNWGIERALRLAAPDVVLCGGYNYVASWCGLRWAKNNSAQFLLWVESTNRDHRSGRLWVELLKKKFLQRCDGFVVPGRASLDYLRNYGLQENAIFIAPNAVDNQLFRRCAETARNEADIYRSSLCLPPRYFLFCGRLVREKGVFELLEAYQRLVTEIQESVSLVFVGDGRDRSELAMRAGRTAPGKVLFPGFAQRHDLAAYYALSDALVFPTHTDPWGLVVNEAMACGIPVICSDAAGCAPDLVVDHQNGIRVDAGNVEQLSDAMDEMARNPETRARMGQCGAERIRGYSPEAWADGIVNLLGLTADCAA
jgi:glycosyltransferase involved in cell wall biosynthesis